ncbi:MAG: DNA-processing protein DprA [Lachnospiraceae bacterium]|nr:DNA-processing protein DprA [Lachnospiraceae bacterium]
MEEYWEWFCSIPGIYRTQREILLHCFHDPRKVWDASMDELTFLKNRGCRWMQKVIDYKKRYTPAEAAHMRASLGIEFISAAQEGYPQRLKPLRDRPYGLFVRGALPPENARSVAIVGARMCTPGGRAMAEAIAREVVHCGGVVVSGAAYGIDGAAQWAALEEGGKSYAVLGCGVDVCYPASHQLLFSRLSTEGGLISEFPSGTKAMPTHFPMRNRIISGLADIVVVVEARKKSGSLITAEFALDQGRPVYAVPGRPDDELSYGCNELISQGAGLILSVEDFAETVFPDKGKTERKTEAHIPLAPGEKLVYSKVGLHGKSLWELQENTALSLSDLCDSLLSLELKGLIKETEQNFYIKMK